LFGIDAASSQRWGSGLGGIRLMSLLANVEPAELQRKWLAAWKEKGCFHPAPEPTDAGRANAFAIVIPPPNVTGALHLGHGINNTIQDILTRRARMDGKNALWVPGTDHAGIATQAVVERLLKEREGKTRHDVGREGLVERIWQWKETYEKRILGQLASLGSSCDWERTRFTLDDICSRAVRQTFFNLFARGLIFRGKRLVNWDAQLQTSVADDETYVEDTKGGFWTFHYKVEGVTDDAGQPAVIRFSTTRPETLLGDTALCVHPDDARYQHLIGKLVTQPLVGRKIPIIADGLLADPELGTGCVKVTPAHDPNDYACYQRKLGKADEFGMINLLNPDGTLNDAAGRFQGLDRYKARDAVVAAMEELGQFEGREDRLIPLKYSDRSKTPIEPYLSDQWFVKMGDHDDGSPGLAQLAIDAVTSGRVKFHPPRYADTYLAWLGEKRDWCISRQLWWGHRIPVWMGVVSQSARIGGPDGISWQERDKQETAYRRQAAAQLHDYMTRAGVRTDEYCLKQDDKQFLVCVLTDRADLALSAISPAIEAAMPKPVGQPTPAADPMADYRCLGESALTLAKGLWNFRLLRRESDVLDTWFSSALWPHATLGWPAPAAKDFQTWYPTSVLVTSRDIITLWVARMVMTGLVNCGDIPFADVVIHPKILDGFGETMSKSKGNGVDPLDIVTVYGADALRFGLAHMATETQDARLPVANVCPHCQTLVPVKQEHMYLRTKKLACPSCKKAFRPGGPWPDSDPELPTAKQSSERFEIGRNFGTKIVNAARLILGYVTDSATRSASALAANGPALDPRALPLEDRWILSRLSATVAGVSLALDEFRIADAARQLYDFVWGEMCDWYLEAAKPRFRDDALRPAAAATACLVLDTAVRLLHPVMPFVTEEIFAALAEAAPDRAASPIFRAWQETERTSPGSSAPSLDDRRRPLVGDFLALSAWPGPGAAWRDESAEAEFTLLQELIRAVRNIRAEFQVDPKAEVPVIVQAEPARAEFLAANLGTIRLLGKVGSFEATPAATVPPRSASAVLAGCKLAVPLAEFIDVEAELARQTKKRADLEKRLAGVKSKLTSPAFVDKAPADVVQQQRDLQAEIETQLTAVDAVLADLKQPG
jgi:valyl-tRNA synthetase